MQWLVLQRQAIRCQILMVFHMILQSLVLFRINKNSVRMEGLLNPNHNCIRQQEEIQTHKHARENESWHKGTS
jgi:hypothetical protein